MRQYRLSYQPFKIGNSNILIDADSLSSIKILAGPYLYANNAVLSEPYENGELTEEYLDDQFKSLMERYVAKMCIARTQDGAYWIEKARSHKGWYIGETVTAKKHGEPAYYSNYGGNPIQAFTPGMIGVIGAVEVPRVSRRYRVMNGKRRYRDDGPTFVCVDFIGDNGCVWRVGMDYSNLKRISPSRNQLPVGVQWRHDYCKINAMQRNDVALYTDMQKAGLHQKYVHQDDNGLLSYHIEFTDELIEAWWRCLDNPPAEYRSDGHFYLTEAFLCFPEGTPLDFVREWFVSHHSHGLVGLMASENLDEEDE